jgi:competence protein CoiA
MSMFVALDQNGRLISIEDAQRGLACACTCVGCDEAVIARKGPLREHHFAHYSNKESCFIQRETLLHLYGKQVICGALGLQLPPMPGVFPKSEDPTSWWDFAAVQEEVSQAGFQPDLVAKLRDGSQLFIEIAVTSFIDEEKLARIQAVGIKTVEVDLSDMLFSRLSIPSEELKDQILRRTDIKAWVYPGYIPSPVPDNVTPELSACAQLIPEQTEQVQAYIEHRFNLMGMWVSARVLQSGSVAVRSWSYNPNLAALFKSWRSELGGEYNPKYKS